MKARIKFKSKIILLLGFLMITNQMSYAITLGEASNRAAEFFIHSELKLNSLDNLTLKIEENQEYTSTLSEVIGTQFKISLKSVLERNFKKSRSTEKTYIFITYQQTNKDELELTLKGFRDHHQHKIYTINYTIELPLQKNRFFYFISNRIDDPSKKDILKQLGYTFTSLGKIEWIECSSKIEEICQIIPADNDEYKNYVINIWQISEKNKTKAFQITFSHSFQKPFPYKFGFSLESIDEISLRKQFFGDAEWINTFFEVDLCSNNTKGCISVQKQIEPSFFTQENSLFNISKSRGITSEDGKLFRVEVSLKIQPREGVTFPVESSDIGEGTVRPKKLTFTPENWDLPQKIYITGVNDEISDGNQPYHIRILPDFKTQDVRFHRYNPPDIHVINSDDDKPGFIVDGLLGVTHEKGGIGVFTVRLNQEPSYPIKLGLMSDNIGEGLVFPKTIEFLPENWDAPKQVTVTGVSDIIIDGDQRFRIVFIPDNETKDTYFNGLAPESIEVVNRDETMLQNELNLMWITHASILTGTGLLRLYEAEQENNLSQDVQQQYRKEAGLLIGAEIIWSGFQLYNYFKKKEKISPDRWVQNTNLRMTFNETKMDLKLSWQW